MLRIGSIRHKGQMPPVQPPKNTKENQHFVPRSWLRRFGGKDGRVLSLTLASAEIQQVSVNDIMSGDWIYTVFDEWWRPSDVLEDELAKIEGSAATLFDTLASSWAAPTVSQWVELIQFLALTGCRHPAIMSRGHERAKEMAWVIADIGSYADEDAFRRDMKNRFAADVPTWLYQALLAKGPQALLDEAQEVEDLSPQDPKLPEQLSLSAVENVANSIAVMHMQLLDAPAGSAFVLGDRPLPLREMAWGFDVSLSKSLAFQAWPAPMNGPRVLERRAATLNEVEAINRRQFDRAKAIVIGPDRDILEKLRQRVRSRD